MSNVSDHWQATEIVRSLAAYFPQHHQRELPHLPLLAAEDHFQSVQNILQIRWQHRHSHRLEYPDLMGRKDLCLQNCSKINSLDADKKQAKGCNILATTFTMILAASTCPTYECRKSFYPRTTETFNDVQEEVSKSSWRKMFDQLVWSWIMKDRNLNDEMELMWRSV